MVNSNVRHYAMNESAVLFSQPAQLANDFFFHGHSTCRFGESTWYCVLPKTNTISYLNSDYNLPVSEFYLN